MNRFLLEKQLHPFACKIPLIMWEYWFEGGQYGYDFGMADKPLNTLTIDDFRGGAHKNLVTLIICHPHQDPADRIQFAREFLKMSDKSILLICAQMGELKTCQILQNQMPKDLFIEALKSNWIAFRAAASGGHPEICEWIKDQFTPRQFGAMNKSQHYQAFSNAFEGGHLAMCEWLKNQVTDKVFVKMTQTKLFSKTFYKSLILGHHHLHQWFKEVAPETFAALINNVASEDISDAIHWSLTRGDIATLSWMETIFPDKFAELLLEHQQDYFCSAVLCQTMDSLNWFKLRVDLNLKACISPVSFEDCAQQGSLRKLRWLKRHIAPNLLFENEGFLLRAFVAAAVNRHSHVMRWIKRQVPSQVQTMIIANRFQSFTSACWTGNLSLAKWHKKQVPDSVFSQMVSAKVIYFSFFNSAKNGYIETCQWIKEQMAPDEFKAMFELWPSFGWPEGNDPEYHIPYLWEVCFRVLQTKNLEVFKWLKEQMSSDVYAFIIKNNKFELLDNMMRQKQYNVCNFLLTDQDCFEFVLQDRWYNHEVLEHFYTEQTKLLPVRSTAAIIPGVEIAPGYRAQTLADHIGEDKPRVSAAPSRFFNSPVIDKTIQKTPDQEDITGKYQTTPSPRTAM